jgi:hypothetical protein
MAGIYRVQSVAEIPILHWNKYQARNRNFSRDFCDKGAAATDPFQDLQHNPRQFQKRI